MSAPTAPEGMRFTLAGVELVVRPKCDDKTASGHWACAVHEETFPHNLAMQSHLSDETLVGDPDCAIVWVCHAHGPEVP